ncbi:MAG: DUF839 domain-containing protein [Gammaproteobacteria bacterium]|mgnify:FL=1|jgi:hypothetical protein|nr:DUF839 domain-containing protein [Gammaproteobacteria bacterium]MBT4606440.1 DUF839 domain-containing protein [Thiotrichales bacterium]MBT3966233.1 DUF839 domain-containing protein [Gammaproteobacteria bacterium]MBT4080932.1 DUF839 domain-containing protein [Gammaproteobacteria bacterium]MBT4810186.1 DUF839 domain-containing protein [Thiotrichales bacterium]
MVKIGGYIAGLLMAGGYTLAIAAADVVDYKSGWSLIATGQAAGYRDLLFHNDRTQQLLGMTTDGWVSHIPESVIEFDQNQAGWVYFEQSVAGLPVTPADESAISYSPLTEGWNLVGAGLSATPEQLRNRVESDFSRLELEKIYSYNNEQGWKIHDFENMSNSSPLPLRSADGLWVKLKTPDFEVAEGEAFYEQITIRGEEQLGDYRFELLKQPEKGKINFLVPNGEGAGAFSYTSELNQSGEDTFQYWAVTGSEGDEEYKHSDVVTVRLQINSALIAEAGVAQTVQGWQMVTLDGTGSHFNGGNVDEYVWTQTSGEPVEILQSDQPKASFTAPNKLGSLRFQLTVLDHNSDGTRENVDKVEVTVNEFGFAPTMQRSSLYAVKPVQTEEDQTITLQQWIDSSSLEVLAEGDALALQGGLEVSTLVQWLDRLHTESDTLEDERIGFGNSALAYFGKSWSSEWDDLVVGGAPTGNGSSQQGELWIGHTGLGNYMGSPKEGVAPQTQHQSYAQWLVDWGEIDFDVSNSQLWGGGDVSAYSALIKRESGSSWLSLKRNDDGFWELIADPTTQRLDGTADTRLSLYGDGAAVEEIDMDDAQQQLAVGMVAGLDALEQVEVTPWGSLLATEKEAAAQTSLLSGYLMELMPGEGAADGGTLQRKLIAMGRGWSGVSLAVNEQRELVSGSPLVLYLVDGRAGGRIYKWVSENAYVSGMQFDTVRNLLRSGALYVASVEGLSHEDGYTIASGERAGELPLESDGVGGEWIELGEGWVAGDVAPNSVALSAEGVTTLAGQAFAQSWNGFASMTMDEILLNPDRAANKVGIMELNRPHAVAWDPFNTVSVEDGSSISTPRLLISFLGNGEVPLRLDQQGVMLDASVAQGRTPNLGGALFSLHEQGASVATSDQFTLQHIWGGGAEQQVDVSPDHLLVDSKGSAWFTNRTNNTLYVVRKNELQHYAAVEVMRAPNGFVLGGPTLTPDESTLFVGTYPE